MPISETDDTVTMNVEVVRKRDKHTTTTTFYQLASKWTPTEGKVPYAVRKEMLDHDPNRA